MNRNEMSKGFQEGLMAARINGTFMVTQYPQSFSPIERGITEC